MTDSRTSKELSEETAQQLADRRIVPGTDWTPFPDHFYHGCCDCGLAHKVTVRRVDDHHEMRWEYHDALTKESRERFDHPVWLGLKRRAEEQQEWIESREAYIHRADTRIRELESQIDRLQEAFRQSVADIALDTGFLHEAEAYGLRRSDLVDLANRATHEPRVELSELERAAMHFVEIVQTHRSPYIRENGRHQEGHGPWAELVDAVEAQAKASALTKGGEHG